MSAAAGEASDLPAAARAESENFPVASRLLPRALRRDLLAVYGFARLVDETGDETAGDRLALLDRIEADVARIFEGGEPHHPLTHRLAATVRRREIPAKPLLALIEANRVDQVSTAYRTFDDLLAYCALSANPVGQMVLCIFGATTPERLRLSDAICTALQLAEILQDVVEDLASGRVYLPAEDLARFACTQDDLRAPRASPQVRAMIAFEVARARTLLARGAPLIATLSGRKALAVAGFVAGGRAALTAIERADYDVLAGSPRASRRGRLAALGRTLAGADESATV